jgi:hypothetical protein
MITEATQWDKERLVATKPCDRPLVRCQLDTAIISCELPCIMRKRYRGTIHFVPHSPNPFVSVRVGRKYYEMQIGMSLLLALLNDPEELPLHIYGLVSPENETRKRNTMIEQRPDGYWIVGLPNGLKCGPYDRKADAIDDERGLQRTYKYCQESGFVTVDSHIIEDFT